MGDELGSDESRRSVWQTQGNSARNSFRGFRQMFTIRAIQLIGDMIRRNLTADNANAVKAQRKHYIPAYPAIINWLKGLFMEPGCPGIESSVTAM